MAEDRGRTVLVTLLIVTALFLSLVSVVSQISVKAAEPAKIWTDKPDYAPEETVYISGSGFMLNSTITISVTRPDSHEDVWSVPSDAAGNFETTYQLDGITGTYNVTATDGTNAASTTFTDTSPHIYRIHIENINGYSTSGSIPTLSNPIHLAGTASVTGY